MAATASKSGPVNVGAGRIPAAFVGEAIPPALPFEHSPKQQQDARESQRAAEDAVTPMQELEKLFPREAEVEVMVFAGRDANGKKIREPLKVYAEEATLEEWAAAVKPLEPLFDMMEDTKASISPVQMLRDWHDPIVAAVSATTGVAVPDLMKLRGGDLLAIVETVIKVNQGFLRLRLIPLFGALVAQAGSESNGAGGGQTSGSPALTQVSPSPKK
jgi:hypothetical protein